jgi:hypothetical protein
LKEIDSTTIRLALVWSPDERRTGDRTCATGRQASIDKRRISDRRRIVAFRNILVHRYADVDDQLVWT